MAKAVLTRLCPASIVVETPRDRSESQLDLTGATQLRPELQAAPHTHARTDGRDSPVVAATAAGAAGAAGATGGAADSVHGVGVAGSAAFGALTEPSSESGAVVMEDGRDDVTDTADASDDENGDAVLEALNGTAASAAAAAAAAATAPAATSQQARAQLQQQQQQAAARAMTLSQLAASSPTLSSVNSPYGFAVSSPPTLNLSTDVSALEQSRRDPEFERRLGGITNFVQARLMQARQRAAAIMATSPSRFSETSTNVSTHSQQQHLRDLQQLQRQMAVDREFIEFTLAEQGQEQMALAPPSAFSERQVPYPQTVRSSRVRKEYSRPPRGAPHQPRATLAAAARRSVPLRFDP